MVAAGGEGAMGPSELLVPGGVRLDGLEAWLRTPPVRLELEPAFWAGVERAAAVVAAAAAGERAVYGINTGFGKLAQTRIAPAEVAELQRRLVLSHMCGVGAPLGDGTVRLVLVLKAASLGLGRSGVRRRVIETLLACLGHDLLPVVPSQGSVGASGDLAPLAHVAGALIGVGEARLAGARMAAGEALAQVGLAPLVLGPKEGLALLNGTQVSTALAIEGFWRARRLLDAALVAGAMSVDAVLGSDVPFDPRIHAARRQPGQGEVAALLHRLLAGSAIRASHLTCERVQDPYSLRCQPQVMGACLDLVLEAGAVLEREANGVSDNPLVFAEEGEILSGGNFHAEPVALAADRLALAMAEIGAIAERRIALLTDPALSGLPPFLTPEPGLNSGLMLAQVTAAALQAENKHLATPVATESLPTSANQEDHVSMATYAARRLEPMALNLARIVAIELISAAQGIEFRRPLLSSEPLEAAHAILRELSPKLAGDRPLGGEIEAVAQAVLGGRFAP
jgi:histidine ammonia-lyase